MNYLEMAYNAALLPMYAYLVGSAVKLYLANSGKTVLLRAGIVTSILMGALALTSRHFNGDGIMFCVLSGVLTGLITFAEPGLLILKQGKIARRMLGFSQKLDEFISKHSSSLDSDSDFEITEDEIVEATVRLADDNPDVNAILEQILGKIADETRITGTIERKVYKDNKLIETVTRNVYAVRRGDLDLIPQNIRSQYQIW